MISRIRLSFTAVLIALSLGLTYFVVARSFPWSWDDSLELGFRNPPESAKPRTWWHWTASNVTREGVTKDLEMTIFSSPGWSETGGPWVKPEQAMKKLVWSETLLQGPQ